MKFMKLKRFILFVIFLHIKIHCLYGMTTFHDEAKEDEIIQNKPIVICLGQSCFALLKIREYGLRHLTYPFDWNVTYHNALIQLIQDDFAQFLDENFICFENHNRIWNTLYGGGVTLQDGFTLAHICPAEATQENFYQNFFPIIKERMQRRIRRFYKAINSGKHVYFVRAQVPLGDPKDISYTTIAHLEEVLKNKFPALKFTIIAVNYTDEFKIDWNMPNVINFHHSGIDDRESSKTWETIFQRAGLL